MPHDPRMHTAEHVLNQAMVRTLGCARCFSAHINRKKSKCDYRFHRDLQEGEVRALQELINAQLRRGLEVREEYLDRGTAGTCFGLERLPADAGDRIRIVRVGDFDACPCIGPHVKNTLEVGRFLLISHDFTDGVLRLRFKLGSP
ncbi:MAG: hypothetical protein PHX58_06770 [Desulfovibrio sp.]|nr:hypothetical protein [Desulfovibrio sp.]